MGTRPRPVFTSEGIGDWQCGRCLHRGFGARDAADHECKLPTRLEQAALDYLAARVRNEGATGNEVLTTLIEVDRTWHALRVAAGYENEDA